MTDTLFYLDKITKDAKLLEPLGIKAPCEVEVCVELLEHELSHFSIAAIYNNIIGFQTVLEGYIVDPSRPIAEQRKLAPGLNVLFARNNRLDYIDSFTEKIEAAKSLAEKIAVEEDPAAVQIAGEPSFCSAGRNETSSLCQLVAKIKTVTDELKTEFANILKIKIPATAAGDND